MPIEGSLAVEQERGQHEEMEHLHHFDERHRGFRAVVCSQQKRRMSKPVLADHVENMEEMVLHKRIARAIILVFVLHDLLLHAIATKHNRAPLTSSRY